MCLRVALRQARMQSHRQLPQRLHLREWAWHVSKSLTETRLACLS